MTNATETLRPQPERTPEAYRRDLYRARRVIAQLRDDALASGTPVQVAELHLDAEDIDELWDSLDRIDSRFWEEDSFRRHMKSRTEALRADTQRPWWRFWGPG